MQQQESEYIKDMSLKQQILVQNGNSNSSTSCLIRGSVLYMYVYNPYFSSASIFINFQSSTRPIHSLLLLTPTNTTR